VFGTLEKLIRGSETYTCNVAFTPADATKVL